VLRSRALAGDHVYVTGSLGGSRAGKNFDFEPRLCEGTWLRESGMIRAMIDISDGLVTDLRHLATASGKGATLLEDSIPVSGAAKKLKDDRAPIDHALYDGEDFELLFTVPQEKKEEFEAAWKAAHKLPCTAIAHVKRAAGKLSMIGHDGKEVELAGGGFEHFKSVS